MAGPRACHSSPVTAVHLSLPVFGFCQSSQGLLKTPRPGAGPLSSSLPSEQRLSFDIALPGRRTTGTLTDGDPSSPSAGMWEISEPQAPLLSSFQICCHYFIIVLISWLAKQHCQLINDGNIDSRGRKKKILTLLRAPVTTRLEAGVFREIWSSLLRAASQGWAQWGVLHSGVGGRAVS